MRSRLVLWNLYATLLVLIILTACGNSPPSQVDATSQTASTEEPSSLLAPTEEAGVSLEQTPPPNPGNSSVVVLTANPVSTLDPYLMVTLHPDGSIAAHVWDTLVALNNNLELEPSLAQSWNLINDLTWEVTLREDVTFHNGEPFNSEAVRFSVERSQMMRDSLETFARDVELKNVEVVDDYTVYFHTQSPIANLPYYLTSLEILPPIHYSEDSAANKVSPIGSGPYQIVEQQAEGRLILKSAPNYWGIPPEIDTIIFQSMPDASQRIAEFEAGRAHLITDLAPEQTKAWDSAVGELKSIESTRRIFVGMRIEDSTPLADKRVRQALNYALDVQTIVDGLLNGYGQRYGSWVIPPNDNPNLSPWSFDPDKARTLLAEAGYDNGFDITLDAPIGRYHQDQAVAQRIAEQLEQVGINVKVRTLEWPIYVEDYLLKRQSGSLFLLGLNSRGNGLEDTANLSFSFPFNLTSWQNAEFERLLKQAQATFNKSQRQVLLNQAQSIAYEETPWIWLWRQYDFYAVSSELNWQPRADGLVYLYLPSTSTGP